MPNLCLRWTGPRWGLTGTGLAELPLLLPGVLERFTDEQLQPVAAGVCCVNSRYMGNPREVQVMVLKEGHAIGPAERGREWLRVIAIRSPYAIACSCSHAYEVLAGVVPLDA